MAPVSGSPFRLPVQPGLECLASWHHLLPKLPKPSSLARMKATSSSPVPSRWALPPWGDTRPAPSRLGDPPPASTLSLPSGPGDTLSAEWPSSSGRAAG